MRQRGLDKQGIRRSFARAAENYDDLAALQRQVGLSLLRRFPLLSTGGPVVDLGCGTGFLSQQLAGQCGDEPLLLMDVALPMLQVARGKRIGDGLSYCCGDAERLPLRDACIAQIYSNLALQWLLEPKPAFSGLKRVLQPGGKLVFSTFGPDTLQELKAAWAAVDDSVHVNRFFSAEELCGDLQASGFTVIEIESQLYRQRYASVPALMRELKGIGAHNVNLDRKRRLTTKAELQAMIANYPQQAPTGDVLATYQVLLVRAEVGA